MFIKHIEIADFRNFKDAQIDFEQSDFPSVFPIASSNGGGKSTLLQFVFIILRCFADNDKKEFIENLLMDTNSVNSETKLARFIVEEQGLDYELEFILSPAFDEDRNFDVFLDVADTKTQLMKEIKAADKYSGLLSFRDALTHTDRITAVLEEHFKKMSQYINSAYTDELYMKARKERSLDGYQSFIAALYESHRITPNKKEELTFLLKMLQSKMLTLEQSLGKAQQSYVTHLFNNENVLLLKTNLPKQLLAELPNKVFLTAPSSQIFLFFSEDQKQEIFSTLSKSKDAYTNTVSEVKNRIEGFSTYDFASTDLILKSFERAFKEDRKTKLRTNEYGDNYDNLARDFNEFLEGKTISVDENFERVIFSLKDGGQELKPEDLSHGELKKLSIYVWLKYIIEPDSIILMDEVDIALHPKWQYQIVDDLAKWSPGSQFLLATHSPQILSSTYYKNLIKLDNQGSTTKVIRYHQPPVDRDINSIIFDIMEAPNFPENLRKLHKEYRKLVDEGKVGSKEAAELKDTILQFESENSEFFQGIQFDLEMME